MTAIHPGERLRRFLAAIVPTQQESRIAEDRAQRIRARVEKDFKTSRILAVGSYSKGTAVRLHSDFDLFVVFSRDEAKKWSPNLASATLIRRVKSSVKTTYPYTHVRIDQQAVRASFEQGAHVIDVVPAIFDSFDRPHQAPLYLIPAGDGNWIRTSPDLQRRYVNTAHEQSGRKLKSLVRMLKWWSSSRSSTSCLSSLYIEWFAIKSSIPVSLTYQQALAYVLDLLASERLPPLADPFGLSSALAPCRTRLQYNALLASADSSARRAMEALQLEAVGKYHSANYKWSLVFNGRFPSRLV